MSKLIIKKIMSAFFCSLSLFLQFFRFLFQKSKVFIFFGWNKKYGQSRKYQKERNKEDDESKNEQSAPAYKFIVLLLLEMTGFVIFGNKPGPKEAIKNQSDAKHKKCEIIANLNFEEKRKNNTSYSNGHEWFVPKINIKERWFITHNRSNPYFFPLARKVF